MHDPPKKRLPFASFIFYLLFKANVIVLLALDPRVIIAAIEADLGEEVRKEVSSP